MVSPSVRGSPSVSASSKRKGKKCAKILDSSSEIEITRISADFDPASQAVPDETKEIAANDAAQRHIRDLWSASSQKFEHEFTAFVSQHVKSAVEEAMDKYLGILKTSFDERLSFTFASPAAAPMDKGNGGEGSSQLEGVAIERKKEKKDSRQVK